MTWFSISIEQYGACDVMVYKFFHRLAVAGSVGDSAISRVTHLFCELLNKLLCYVVFIVNNLGTQAKKNNTQLGAIGTVGAECFF